MSLDSHIFKTDLNLLIVLRVISRSDMRRCAFKYESFCGNGLTGNHEFGVIVWKAELKSTDRINNLSPGTPKFSRMSGCSMLSVSSTDQFTQ